MAIMIWRKGEGKGKRTVAACGSQHQWTQRFGFGEEREAFHKKKGEKGAILSPSAVKVPTVSHLAKKKRKKRGGCPGIGREILASFDRLRPRKDGGRKGEKEESNMRLTRGGRKGGNPKPRPDKLSKWEGKKGECTCITLGEKKEKKSNRLSAGGSRLHNTYRTKENPQIRKKKKTEEDEIERSVGEIPLLIDMGG